MWQSLSLRPSGRLIVFVLLLGGLTISAVTAFGLAADVSPTRQPTALFRGWDKAPDVALVLSGQQHGYLNPCGCSSPQYGGLPRRYNFIQGLKERGWPIAAVDAGELIDPAAHRGPQSLLKYETAMKALDKMGYVAVGLGQHECEMPLLQTLGQYALNFPSPRIVAANLKQRENNFAGAVGAWEVATPKGAPRIGVVGIVGPTIRSKLPAQNPALNFDATTDALNAVLKEWQPQQPELLILVYEGSAAEARACARAFAQFHLVLCLSGDPEPADKPDRVKDTLIVNVGHKGRYVGVVGAYRTGKADQPFDLKYQLVLMGPEYETKDGQENDNPVLGLLEAYAKEVKDGNYLSQHPQRKHPLQVEFPDAAYVGSDACLSCHPSAAKVWSNHRHAHAFDTLTTAKKPGLRQFDGECIVCHTTGFGVTSGYQDDAKTAGLKHVGCESCHGPGSLHAEQGRKTSARLLALMNPYKPAPNESAEQEKQRLLKIDLECQKCHDVDNDVHWSFAKKWPLVVHRTPAKK